MATDDEIKEAWMKIHVEYPYYQEKLVKKYGGVGRGEKQAAEELTLLLQGVWMEILRDVPGHALQAAVLNYIGEGNPYFPHAGDLRQRAFGFLDRANGDECDPYTAWSEVMTVMRSTYNCTPALDRWRDPLAPHALDAIGGMRAVRYSSEQSAPYLMSQFVKAYMRLATRKQGDQRMLPQVRQLVERIAMDNFLATSERDALPNPDDDPTLFNG